MTPCTRPQRSSRVLSRQERNQGGNRRYYQTSIVSPLSFHKIIPSLSHIPIAQAPKSNALYRTSPACVLVHKCILLLHSHIADGIPTGISILKDSRSPESAHRLTHRRDIHHPLRALESATGGHLGEAGSGTGECCAAERGGHAEGHCGGCCCGKVVASFCLERCCLFVWMQAVGCLLIRSCAGRRWSGWSELLGWSAPGGRPEAGCRGRHFVFVLKQCSRLRLNYLHV